MNLYTVLLYNFGEETLIAIMPRELSQLQLYRRHRQLKVGWHSCGRVIVLFMLRGKIPEIRYQWNLPVRQFHSLVAILFDATCDVFRLDRFLICLHSPRRPAQTAAAHFRSTVEEKRVSQCKS